MRKLTAPILLSVLLVGLSVAYAQESKHFIPVEGPSLRARLDTAVKMGRANPQHTRFWTAYTFDVRPGVAVDFEIVGDDGSVINFSGGSAISFDSTIETRNLGVFMLHEAAGNAAATIARVEIYNLERRREYGNYPVYWLGRAANEESLDLLKSLTESNQASGEMVERATTAIGLHDDARVAPVLENIIRRSSVQPARARAVAWLSHTPGVGAARQQFFAELARNEQEDAGVRKKAVHAIGQNKDAAALALLENLYGSVTSMELKKSILSAIYGNDNRVAAGNFLIKIINSGADAGLRKKAIVWLSRIAGRHSAEGLNSVVNKADAETEVQKQAVHAIGRRPADEAVPLLIKVARTHPKAEVRREAILRLGRIADERVVGFFKELLAK